MKHGLKPILILVSFFLITQIFGLFLLANKLEYVETISQTGETVLLPVQNDTVSRPELNNSGAFLWIAIGIIIGTTMLLLLQRLKKPKIWKYWFLLAVITAITIALEVIMPRGLALLIAITLAILKIYHKQIIIHNLTEILMYSGIAVLAAPLFNILWASLLLIAISVYDMYAVWKSKHMVRMAKFMTETTFAGLMLPYKEKEQSIRQSLKGKIKTKSLEAGNSGRVAILGGGDVAFPLIFSGAVMRYLAPGEGIIKIYSYGLIVAVFAAIALTTLLIKGKKDSFYPAMPFISAGCFIGLGVVYLLSQFV